MQRQRLNKRSKNFDSGSQSQEQQKTKIFEKSVKKSVKKPVVKMHEVCAVCLTQMDDQFVTLNCSHKFCTQQCARSWWRLNEYCPYCRKIIEFIKLMNGKKIQKDQMSEVQSSDDQNFIPRCIQCWGDIEQGQQKKICKTCSTNYIHKNCIMFECRFWQCQQCAKRVDSSGKEIYPVIPYNEVIHYLASLRY